ncbi:hypothetical protein AKJ09_08991 [Labilithrix luteola]|uniref:Uncharacterized protein n=1 Tax=Labilithrix luteola TaxID=1391654 RepID=A0A0K1Q9B8_9BACT|nr:hypothetical protein [Labilithrix luteola]AKV02328.1 hypothetical protein AKJ09_08991 [Labilithrix luteola]
MIPPPVTPPSTPTFTETEIRVAADEHHVHYDTIVKALAGLPVRGSAGVRASAAVAALRGKVA